MPSPSSFPYSISFSLSHAFFPSSLFHVPLSASVCYYPLIIFLIRLFFVKKEQCLSDVKSPFTFLRKQRRCCAFTISLSAEDSPPLSLEQEYNLFVRFLAHVSNCLRFICVCPKRVRRGERSLVGDYVSWRGGDSATSGVPRCRGQCYLRRALVCCVSPLGSLFGP